MKPKPYYVRLAAAALAIGFLSGCTLLEGSSSQKSDALDAWVKKHLSKDETLLCQHEEDGEYFFAARLDDKVKVGSRLDVTGTSPSAPVKAFIRAWHFRNESDKHLVANVPPSSVKEELIKSDGRFYAEDIQIQTLHLAGSHKMRVAIDVKKCPTAECDRQQTRSADEKQYTLELCKVTL